MQKKILKNKNQILELIFIFIITISYNLICANISGDEIWNYGFSYNISTGLIPYKDFNMIINPLFPMMGAMFLSIFGKSFFIYHIFNALLCTGIFYILKKEIKYNYYLIYLLILLNSYPSYNLLCLFLLYVLTLCENKKTNDYLIGIILGLTFLTKQNIGIYLCIPTLFTKNRKKVFKRIIGFLLPNLVLLVYLLITNSLLEFIDYTVLGIFDFTKEESARTNPLIIIITIIITIYLIYQYRKTKDATILYVIMFQLLAYPVTDKYHIMISLIPVIGYILKNIQIPKIIPIIFCTTYIITTLAVNIVSIQNKQILFPNDTNTYTYKKLTPRINDYIIKSSNTLKNINNDSKLFLIAKDAYLLKLEASIKTNKYDILNDGNFGKDGQKGYINDIKDTCNNQKCIFLLEIENEKTKNYAKDIKKYIKDHYNGGYIKDNFIIYNNY